MHMSTCLDPEWGATACFLHKAATYSLRTQACTDGTENSGKEAGVAWQACAVAGQASVKDIQAGSYCWVLAVVADGVVKWEAIVVGTGPCFTWGLLLGNRWEKAALTGVTP